MIDVMKNWLDHWTSKNEIKKEYGGKNPLPNRPNTSRKMYDSGKMKKHLEKIDSIFEVKDEKFEDFEEKMKNQESFKLN